LQNVINKIKYN